MRSRRITIEGNRYLIFYTFDDEPWLGPAATGDSCAQRTGEPNGAVAREDRADEQSAGRPKLVAPEGRDV